MSVCSLLPQFDAEDINLLVSLVDADRDGLISLEVSSARARLPGAACARDACA